MRARDVVAELAAARGDAALVVGPGALSGAVFAAADCPATIYNMDFGYPTPTALGLAIALPGLRVVSLEGDGSFAASIPVLGTIARYHPPNLTVVVVDNGIFGTGSGDVETVTSHGTNLAAVARACGMPDEHILAPVDLEQVARDLAIALARPGPWLVHVRVDADETSGSGRRPRPGIDFVEAGLRFQAAIREWRRTAERDRP